MTRGRPPKTTRDEWLRGAATFMAESGVDALSVEALARQLGVTKGGFYGHFRDRAELLEEVVAYWEEAGTEAIIRAVDEMAPEDVVARSEALWELATADSIGPELAIRDWSRRDAAVRAAVERVDSRRMHFLRTLFSELGFCGVEREARCLLVYSLLIGDHFIAASHGRHSRRRILAECRALLRR